MANPHDENVPKIKHKFCPFSFSRPEVEHHMCFTDCAWYNSKKKGCIICLISKPKKEQS